MEPEFQCRLLCETCYLWGTIFGIDNVFFYHANPGKVGAYLKNK